MPVCIYVTQTSDKQCTKESIEGGERCQKHHDAHVTLLQRIGALREGGCTHITTGKNARRCDRFAEEGNNICTSHRRANEKKIENRERARVEQEQVDILYEAFTRARPEGQTYIPWHIAILPLIERWRDGIIPLIVIHIVSRRYYRFLGRDLENYDLHMRNLFRGIIPGQETQLLQTIAADTQNVHTTLVTQQTNTGLKKILEAIVPVDPCTLSLILRAFMNIYKVKKMDTFLAMMMDANTWYNTQSCRKENDWLYKNVLDGAWVLIQDSEHKDALTKRLYEEMRESTGLCCDGHITRLINVFVGFDTVFETPISRGEIIQNKMSAIAMRDDSLDEKIRAANLEFDELGVLAEERQQWLAAF